MLSRKIFSLTLVAIFFSNSCSSSSTPVTTIPSSTEPSQVKTSFPSISSTEHAVRQHLTYDELVNGFDFDSPIVETALSFPEGSAQPAHIFEGRLELNEEAAQGEIQVLRGELDSEWGHLPEFDFAFVQSGSYLIPVQRGSIISEHPNWNYILEPGRVWQESSDNGYSRTSFPFALVVKGGNATFNGTMTFLFTEGQITKVWYQITQETTTNTRANFWGLLDASYHPEPILDADKIITNFELELSARFPTKPIEALVQDFPGVDLSAFGYGITPEHMTWFGYVINGTNYLGGCQTRFGRYPYCESMRATSYSTAKSAFASIALMRLAQKYHLGVTDLLIKDYVSEAAASPGDWSRVTFNHALDMSTGNYSSPGYMVDEDSLKMNEFFGAQPYANRITQAFDWPNSNNPGRKWVYRTSDTFILTRALHNFLENQEGFDADIFEFVTKEVYQPLGLGPGFFSTMRTSDNKWNGQPEGGYGLWWIPDDIAKISNFLNNQSGQIGDIQVLHPDILMASLQRIPDDRGLPIDQNRMYNNAFWANVYSNSDGFDCEIWVPQMLGVSGNVVALMPNSTVYYYFSDNQEFSWDTAIRESDKLIPMCTETSNLISTKSLTQSQVNFRSQIPVGIYPLSTVHSLQVNGMVRKLKLFLT